LKNHILQRILFFFLIAVCATATKAQSPPKPPASAANFNGEWEWAVYAKSRDELPPAYQSEKLRDVPGAAIYLKLKQRGRKLSGEYSASRRFLAKLEDGGLDGAIKGNVTRLELESGFGGKVTVLLILAGNRLHWKTIKSEGEQYFPDDVFLHRVVKRRKGA
jgi:hypothetical protein